jgi:large subunit ribosomal protein L9
MRVVFLEDVQGVAQGGEVKEVKNGFARNYLIPMSLAVPATHNALQRVERLKRQAETDRLKRLKDTRALAEELDGVQVNIEMRAGASGQLFGSVTTSIIADELSKLTDRKIDRRTVELAEPIRELGASDVTIRLLPEIDVSVKVLVYATGTEPTIVDEESEADVPAEEAVEEVKEPADPEDVTEPSEEPEESD